MNVLFLPLAAFARDEATAKLCRQIPRLLGAEFERATEAHGVKSKFLSSRGTTEDGSPGLVASLELPGPSDLETTARMYGADLIVSGRFGLSDRNLILELRVYQVSGRSEVWAKRFETYPSYYFDAVEETKVRIAQILGLDLAERERVALLRRDTESWQALLYYLFAEDDRYAVSLGIPASSPMQTLDLYREALSIDPELTKASDGLQHYLILLIEHQLIDLGDLRRVIEDNRALLPEPFLTAVNELL